MTLFAILLGVGIAATQSGCRFYGHIAITDCDEGRENILGRVPFTVCLQARGQQDVVVQYAWDFGDGSTAAEKQVTHTYTVPGEHKVRLEVVYQDGSHETDALWISAAGDPEAAFVYEPTPKLGWFRPSDYIDNGLNTTFDATSSYPSDDAVEYHPEQLIWDFGDGTQETKRWHRLYSWSFLPGFGGSSMTIRHQYAAAGTYTVTLTLTGNLGYSDTVSQTITVGEQDEEDLAENFDLTTIFWQVEDEDEEAGCLSIYGTVQNNNAVAAGVELTATAFDAVGTAVGTISYWPAGAANIGAGVNYAFGFFLCDLSVPAEQVADVEVEITDAVAY